jgi:hypothetical protein
MWKVFEWLFRAWDSANKVAEKGLPDAELQKKQFEIKKETLTEAQVKKIADKRNRLADEMFGDLQRHPEISIQDKVLYEARQLDTEEKILLIKILTDRLNSDKTYLRIKNKKSKFKL